MLKKLFIIIIMFIIVGCASTKTYTPSYTVEGLHDEIAQLNRVSKITHNILVPNSLVCTRTKAEYGFRATSLTGHGNKVQRELQIKAFNLQKQPTVTLVIPKSAADKAGLHLGDAIISVNSTRWSDSQSHGKFVKLIGEAMQSPHLNLGILRNGKKKTLSLTADKACDYSFILSLTNEHGAFAVDRNIILESGAVKLLKRDDELAFYIAHELAHILLGHTLPEMKKELDDSKMRHIMEKDADALGIRLMMNAGYNPEGAESALKSTDLIDSGLITKFFNYHGSYMSIDERIRYLKEVADQ